MDNETQSFEIQPVNLPLETQVACARGGALSALAILLPFVAFKLIRRALKAGEGRFDD